MLRRLASDESRHAELAWQFVRWGIETGGADVLTAAQRGIRRAVLGTLAAERRAYDVDLAMWHAHGRVSCDEAHAIAAAGIEAVVDPALHALDAPLWRRAASTGRRAVPTNADALRS
jgi:hypothetical protein